VELTSARFSVFLEIQSGGVGAGRKSFIETTSDSDRLDLVQLGY
jgi:hypothetical protein